ncbi:MAG: asparagine synthase (glutamine-hydrolyzing) [Bacteroidota bacterium]
MCGIAGYYSPSGRFTKPDLEKMNGTLVHRGPDAEGYFTDDTAGLAHRRLSILDLSSSGNQPMLSHDSRYLISYNGEVYNYIEIANELNSQPGGKLISFRSSSDTEVILEAFAFWGPEFVHKLNGMFAIAIYDTLKKELFVFRDRVGIKPLYYYWNGDDFVFASELKALCTLKQIPRELDQRAIDHFLHLGYIPAPLAIYTAMHKMDSGTWLKISKAGLETNRYWSPASVISREVIGNERKALVVLSNLIKSSVQYQLKSDVPVGIFLSGGIDSSLIAAEAVNLSTVKVNTFSIGFGENRYNESGYAAAVARYLGTNHHEFIVSYKDAIGLIDTVFEAYSEPFGDSSSIPTMLVSKLAKKYVTVTLSGEGGDELFLGYGSYRWARRLNNPLIRTFRKPIGRLLGRQKSNRMKRAALLFGYADGDNVQSHILSQEQYLFSQREIADMRPDSVSGLAFDTAYAQLERSLNAVEKQALFDISSYLQYDLLTKVDRASMHFSLETRVPYLDHRIIEYAVNLSTGLKIRGNVSKYILKEILYQYVPEKYFMRPKQGFAIPLETWLRSELRFLIADYLSESVIARHALVRFDRVRQLIQRFEKGEYYLFNRLWILIALHKWMEKNRA